MSTHHQAVPYRRVVTLSVALLALMAGVVGLGSLGVTTLDGQFTHMVSEDLPRFDNLLHIDRDLFRAQRALEVAVLNRDPVDRFEHIEEYHDQVARTAERWGDYLSLVDEEEAALALVAAHAPARTAWLASSGALAEHLVTGLSHDDPRVNRSLQVSQNDFLVLREVIHDLEEEVAETHIAETTGMIRGTAGSTVDQLLALSVFGLLVGGLISFTTYRAVRTQHRRAEHRDVQQKMDARRSAFEAELHQALDMAQTEEAAIGVVELVVAEEVPERPTELLLADSSQAHLEQAITTRRESGSGCEVFDPSDCPAIRRGATLSFEHSTAYSACPHMRIREGDPFSAVCVPMSVAGRVVGVLHSTGDQGVVANADQIHVLEQVADRAGDRVGVLRAFAQSQTQAATDPLTGLLNRRSFETQASRRLRSGRELAFAYGDLDHFKKLNDRHGHEAGDRALRLFSKVLSDSVRDGDLVARWGGEEFVVMIDDSKTESAVGLVERIRENLVLALAGSNSAPFTASFGVSDTTMSDDLEQLVALADDSLLEAKRRGRDRVIVAGSWDAGVVSESSGAVVAS